MLLTSFLFLEEYAIAIVRLPSTHCLIEKETRGLGDLAFGPSVTMTGRGRVYERDALPTKVPGENLGTWELVHFGPRTTNQEKILMHRCCIICSSGLKL